jgi:hypothetical protein
LIISLVLRRGFSVMQVPPRKMAKAATGTNNVLMSGELANGE